MVPLSTSSFNVYQYFFPLLFPPLWLWGFFRYLYEKSLLNSLNQFRLLTLQHFRIIVDCCFPELVLAQRQLSPLAAPSMSHLPTLTPAKHPPLQVILDQPLYPSLHFALADRGLFPLGDQHFLWVLLFWCFPLLKISVKFPRSLAVVSRGYLWAS